MKDKSGTIFGSQVERAAIPDPDVWLLVVFDVPDRLAGLLQRFGFKRTTKKPNNFFRGFDAEADRDLATKVRKHLLDAGLKGRWIKLNAGASVKSVNRDRPSHKPFKPTHSRSYGYTDMSKPNVGGRNGWRMRQRRK